jgi:hypothetical protein
MTNREEVKRGDAEPKVEEVYDTVKRSRRDKVEAQKDVAKRIAKDIEEEENKKTLSLIHLTLHNKSKSEVKFNPGVRLDWTKERGESPDMSPEEARDRYSGRKMGKSKRGKKSEIVLEVQNKGRARTAGCGYNEKFDSVVPSGLSMHVERVGQTNIKGTTGPACYDQDYGTSGWMSAWHLFNEHDESDYAYSPSVETNAYF